MRMDQWILRWLSLQPRGRIRYADAKARFWFQRVRYTSGTERFLWTNMWATDAADFHGLLLHLRRCHMQPRPRVDPTGTTNRRTDNIHWLFWICDVSWVLGKLKSKSVSCPERISPC